jgi:hypothetical protein
MNLKNKIIHKYHFAGTAYDCKVGPCALYSIKNSYKKLTGRNLSLRALANLSQNNDYVDYDTKATKPEFARLVSEKLNLSIKPSRNIDEILQSVKSGQPVIIQSTGGKDIFNIGSHAMTITGYNADGFLEITDSAFNKKRFTAEQFKQGTAYIKGKKIYIKPELLDENIKQAFIVNMKNVNDFE